MQTYRIYTEDMARNDIRTIVGKYFDSYTMIPCIGVWKHAEENSLIIEIIESVDRWADVTEVAERIRYVNNQDAILVLETNTYNAIMIDRKGLL